MNPVQIHLALNHFPVVGILFALLILMYALWKNKNDFFKLVYIITFLCGIMGLLLHWSGENSEEQLEKVGKQEKNQSEYVETHEEWAEIAVPITSLLMLFSPIGFVFLLYLNQFHKYFAIAFCIYLIVNCIIIAQTAHSGGLIEHTLIR